jgi:hypothetical protein
MLRHDKRQNGLLNVQSVFCFVDYGMLSIHNLCRREVQWDCRATILEMNVDKERRCDVYAVSLSLNFDCKKIYEGYRLLYELVFL